MEQGLLHGYQCQVEKPNRRKSLYGNISQQWQTQLMTLTLKNIDHNKIH